MYEYKEEDLENIKALRTIIEYMLREHYLRLNADIIMNYYYNINVVLLFSKTPPGYERASNRVTFGFNNGAHRGYLKVQEEVGTLHFWGRLRKNKCLLDDSKTNYEYTSHLKDRDIGYISKYIRKNVLVRNVKLFE